MDALIDVQERLNTDIQQRLTRDIAAFLLSFHDADPDFDLIGLPRAGELPAVRWKLINLEELNWLILANSGSFWLISLCRPKLLIGFQVCIKRTSCSEGSWIGTKEDILGQIVKEHSCPLGLNRCGSLLYMFRWQGKFRGCPLRVQGMKSGLKMPVGFGNSVLIMPQ